MTRTAWHAERIARSGSIEAPTVESVNLQVRTGMSVPFAAHMLGTEAPSVDGVNLQVRTGMSVPFAPHMLDKAGAPSVEPVDLQVRTGMSVPFASYMVSDKPSQPATTAKVTATTPARKAKR